MDQRIIELMSTTFSGRRLNRQQTAYIQEAVDLLPNDNRNERAKTISDTSPLEKGEGRLQGRGLPRVHGCGRRAAAGRASGGVDGLRDPGEARRGRVQAPAPGDPRRKGRRILAVGGSKITLPGELAVHGFRVADGARHPQGMASVLCRLRDRIPVDHENERKAALTHLDHAAEGDVIVHDRGCFPFAMAPARRAMALSLAGTDFPDFRDRPKSMS